MPSAASSPIICVDLGLGADVDAARRLVEDQHARLRVEPLARASTFCWLPPESLRDRRVDRRRADRQPLAEASRRSRAPSPCRSRPKPVEIARERRQRDVRRDRHRQRQAELAAVLGEVGDAVRHRLPRRADRSARLPSSTIVAARRPARCRTAPGRRRCGRRRQAGEARAPRRARSVEADVREDALAAEPVDRQHDVARAGRRSRAEEVRHLAPDHVADRALAASPRRAAASRSAGRRGSTVTRSAISNTSSRRWLTKRIATPWSREPPDHA